MGLLQLYLEDGRALDLSNSALVSVLKQKMAKKHTIFVHPGHSGLIQTLQSMGFSAEVGGFEHHINSGF